MSKTSNPKNQNLAPAEPERLPHRWAIILIGTGMAIGVALVLGAPALLAMGCGVPTMVALHQILA